MVREPWRASVYEAYTGLSEIPETARTTFRWAGDALRSLNAEAVESVTEALRSYVGHHGLTWKASGSAWARTEIATTEDASLALSLAQRLRRDVVPAVVGRLEAAAAETGLIPAPIIADWQSRLTIWSEVSHVAEAFQSNVFEVDLDQLTTALAPAAAGGFSRFRASLFSGTYRGARSALRPLALAEAIDDGQLYEAAVGALESKRHWTEIGSNGNQPAYPGNLAELSAEYQTMTDELERLSKLIDPQENLAQRAEAECLALLDELIDDRQTLYRVPELRQLEAEFAAVGVDALVDEMSVRALSDDDALDCLRFAWLMSILDEVQLSDPRIGTFDGTHHSRTVEEFRGGDKAHFLATAQRIRRAYAEHAIRARNAFPEEAEKVRAHAKRKRGHKPTRTLFREAPNALLALKPCWAMSPLLVSQTLPAHQLFDVVIFDEASQITPADAVAAILRGQQVIVAGDDKQLPPTSFFMTATPEEEEDEEELLLEAATHGYESILNVLDVFLSSRMLTWHYRSQCEQLIAFSNGHFYDKALTTFPGAAGEGCVRHVLVPFEGGLPGQEQSVSDEVKRVVELILEHARERSSESLGVIAMGIKHGRRIDDALREALRDNPELDEFFAEDKGANEERFFVKNLERVQGDERDAIILSVGYGKTTDGRLLYRFGPLNIQGGERRLNVAITRAKKRMTLVSSFDAHDLDPERSSASGVTTLRQYLEYAASGGRNLGAGALESPELNPFEIDVRNRLSEAGIPLEPQWGASGYRIDYVAKHPARPGRFVLAIECDGASYHSIPTVRDRDRLRQSQLEHLGWKFHRIWSTEWFHDKEKVVAQTLERYRRAVEEVDAADAAAALRASSRPDPMQTEVAVVDTVPSPPVRERRPPVPRGKKIDDYTRTQLVSIVRWIESDTLLRSDEELLRLVMEDLGFQRARSRIRAAILNAIKTAHRS
jgi:very-short-patch-repair endonuclease